MKAWRQELRFLNPWRLELHWWARWQADGNTDVAWKASVSRMVQAPRGSHPGQSGSLGSREGSVPSPGTGPLGCPDHCGRQAERKPGWSCLEPGGLTGSPRAGQQLAVCSQRLTAKAAFAFLTLGLGQRGCRGTRGRKGEAGAFRAWAGGMARPLLGGELRPGGELWCAAESTRRETLLARM